MGEQFTHLRYDEGATHLTPTFDTHVVREHMHCTHISGELAESLSYAPYLVDATSSLMER